MTADAGVQVTELGAEDHACLTFGESEELFDLTAAFVRDGLSAGLKVVWLSDVGPGLAAGELGRRGVRGGVGPGQRADDRGGLGGPAADGAGVPRERGGRLAGTASWSPAGEQGFPGLRVALDMSWALRPVAGIEELPSSRKASRRRSTAVPRRCSASTTGSGSTR